MNFDRSTLPLLQPALHDRSVVVRSPVCVLSAPDGQLDAALAAVDGLYADDRRLLSVLRVELPGCGVDALAGASEASGAARYDAVVRGLGEPTPDPVLVLARERELPSDGPALRETVTLTAYGTSPVRVPVVVTLASDLAAMQPVKQGYSDSAVSPSVAGQSVYFERDGLSVRVTLDRDGEWVTASGAEAQASFDVALAPGEQWSIGLSVETTRSTASSFSPGRPARIPWRHLEIATGDERLSRFVSQSLMDLEGLVVTDPLASGDCFLAAGVPWYLTLFGRDSLWAARMLLPLGTDLARGTLRTLARRQGSVVEPQTEEQPGKMLHEVRSEETTTEELSLPPLYYGTIDATPLWACLMHDAWRHGMAETDVAGLLPALESALAWVAGPGDSDGDGFLEYRSDVPGGLSNQGWKDSGDAVQFPDGRQAEGPIALAEVQAYAHEALVHGADLLEAFGRDGTRWRERAALVRSRFRERFWVSDADGDFPALALDGSKRPVDVPASNLGHLLGTGLLDAAEEELVAARLVSPALASGFGLRTLAATAAGFNPVGYHTGSVWAHDTAIAIAGLARSGHRDKALQLAEGLVRAAAAFDYRIPELHGGLQRRGDEGPLPYPAACRPQAWSAAGSVHVLAALLGWEPDVPRHSVGLAPTWLPGFGHLRLTGFVLDGTPVAVSAVAGGAPQLEGLPEGFLTRSS